MYVVLDLQGHQYIVKQGDKIVVDKVKNVNEGDTFELDKVLMLFDEEWKDVKIGRPYLNEVKVTFKIVEHKKGEKIHVIKFKNKNRYFRKIWFRPCLTVLQVEDIKS